MLLDGSQDRSKDTIDRICDVMEPSGDTLAVVINVQDVFATTSEDVDTLSWNCQLGTEESAMLLQKRQLDALDPQVRRLFRGQQGLANEPVSSSAVRTMPRPLKQLSRRITDGRIAVCIDCRQG